MGKWKLRLGNQSKPPKPKLYDLEADNGETVNLAAQHLGVVERLKKHAERARAELGDDDRKGSGQRPAMFVKNPQGLVKKNPNRALKK